jgi:Leucine Rich repeat
MESFSPPPRRWWKRPPLRVSLRVLMILVLIVAGVFGWVVNRARTQRHAIARIDRAGGSLMFDDAVDDDGFNRTPSTSAWRRWLGRTLGDDFVRKPRNLFMNGRLKGPLAEETWRAMADLLDLVAIHLMSDDVDDQRLAFLKRFRDLRVLHLDDNDRVTNAGIAHLKNLDRLRHLGLRWTSIDDASLIHLKGLTRLEYLDLTGTRITDAGSPHLRILGCVEYLNLSGTGVTDSALMDIGSMTSLKEVVLPKEGVTAEGIATLKRSAPHLSVQRL